MATSVCGTRSASDTCTTTNSTIAVMHRKWTSLAFWKLPNSASSSEYCTGFHMANPEMTIRMPTRMTPT